MDPTFSLQKELTYSENCSFTAQVEQWGDKGNRHIWYTIRKTFEAAVKFKPTPPAFSDINKT